MGRSNDAGAFCIVPSTSEPSESQATSNRAQLLPGNFSSARFAGLKHLFQFAWPCHEIKEPLPRTLKLFDNQLEKVFLGLPVTVAAPHILLAHLRNLLLRTDEGKQFEHIASLGILGRFNRCAIG